MPEEKELSLLKAVLESSNSYIKKELKNKYIGLMVEIGDFFKFFNLLHQYVEINKSDLRRIGIEELAYEVESKDDKKDDISLVKIFDRSFLEKLDIEELAALNTFWQNRFVKDTSSINTAIFYINTLNLWDDIISDKEIDLDNIKILDAVILKSKFMQQTSNNVLDSLRNSSESSSKKILSSKKVYDPTKELNDLNKSIGLKYKDYFDKILPESENDFLDDIHGSLSLFSNMRNIYYCKDSIILNLLNMYINSKKIKNWGYMSEMHEKGKNSQDSIKNKKYILIGIDFEGYNMPIRVHVKKEELEEQLKLTSGKTIIPIYEGEEDFWYKDYRGGVIKTQFFVPLDKKHKNTIRDLASKISEDDKKYRLMQHLNFLKNADKFPEHLKEEVVRKNKVTRKRNKKYIDIATGKIYTMNKNEYVLINNEKNNTEFDVER